MLMSTDSRTAVYLVIAFVVIAILIGVLGWLLPPASLPEPLCPGPTDSPIPDQIRGYVAYKLTNACSWGPDSTPIGSVPVTLTDAGPDGAFGTGDDSKKDGGTAPTGCYAFDVEAPGLWRVSVPIWHSALPLQCAAGGDPDRVIEVKLVEPDQSSTGNNFGYWKWP